MRLCEAPFDSQMVARNKRAFHASKENRLVDVCTFEQEAGSVGRGGGVGVVEVDGKLENRRVVENVTTWPVSVFRKLRVREGIHNHIAALGNMAL